VLNHFRQNTMFTKHCSRLKFMLAYFGQSTPYSNIALITKYVEALQRELVVLKHIWGELIVLKHWRGNKWSYHFAFTTSPLNNALKMVKTSSKSFNNMAVRTNRDKIFEKCKCRCIIDEVWCRQVTNCADLFRTTILSLRRLSVAFGAISGLIII